MSVHIQSNARINVDFQVHILSTWHIGIANLDLHISLLHVGFTNAILMQCNFTYRIKDEIFCFAHLQRCHNGWASNILSGGYRRIHAPRSKSWMPFHYDTIEDKQNKKSHLLFIFLELCYCCILLAEFIVKYYYIIFFIIWIIWIITAL